MPKIRINMPVIFRIGIKDMKKKAIKLIRKHLTIIDFTINFSAIIEVLFDAKMFAIKPKSTKATIGSRA